ncbi:MAG: AMP-dependent synthetase [Nocardioides sp.]|nr:AMP-dependent synthetase [Nocardioides sp.]
MDVLTAGDSEHQQRRAAGALGELGIRAGDRMVLSLPGSTALVSVVLGALRSGVVPVMLDPHLTPVERDQVLANCQPSLVVDDHVGLTRLLNSEPGPLADSPLARPMHYTSGTTGHRKGVWSGVLDDEAASALLLEERELWRFEPSDVHLVLSALHHSAPLRFAAGTLMAGGAIAVLPSFGPREAIEALAHVRPSTTFCAPAHLQRIFAAVDAGAVLPSLAQVRLLAHAGAPCPPPLKERTVDTLPVGSVWEFYGSTEGQFTACSPEDSVARPGSVGRPRPGRELSLDADGTIWCRVPAHARFSYWRDPEKTARAWRGDAFTVGDLGRLDDEGFLYLDGRREDLLITGGVNVYPLEVELALRGLPGVQDVAVFGCPDEQWGQRVCAAYVGEVSEIDLRTWAAQRLSPPKRPKSYYRLEALPHTVSGKVRRTALAKDLGLEG